MTYIPTADLIEMLKTRNLSDEDRRAIEDAIRPWQPYSENTIPKGCVVEVKLSKELLGSDRHPAKIMQQGIIIVAGHFLFDLDVDIVAWRSL